MSTMLIWGKQLGFGGNRDYCKLADGQAGIEIMVGEES